MPAHRGKITLRITVWPYADLQALQAGSDWIVKDGRKAESDARILGDDLCTPLVVEDLDIADYAIVLVHPELGERSLTISGQGLENGRTYYVSGSLDKPDSPALRGAR